SIQLPGHSKRIRKIWLSRNHGVTGRQSNRIPVGLVGLGGWGHKYVEVLLKSKSFHLRACCDIRGSWRKSDIFSIGFR
ncbi:hypothetical protein KAR91_02485, partial [Candidatus Pacearchaeota archaeon]|nr:hypothetical protein [Candidatus Pacearchaeota archaeon]